MGWFTSEDGTGTAIKELNGTNCTQNLTLYAKWKKPQVDVSVTKGLSVKKTSDTDAGTITLTTTDGFTGHKWTLEGKDLSGFKGFAISEDGKTVTITTADLLDFFGYNIGVQATKDGKTHTAAITITK